MTRDEALTGLQALLEQDSEPGAWFAMTQERIDVFADNTLDPQWIHTDVERAKRESPYGNTIAHGFLTLSLIGPLTHPHSPITAFRKAAKYAVNYGLNKVRFPAPVRADARLRGVSRLLSVKPVDGGGLEYVRRVTIEVEGEDKPACVAEQVHRLYF